MTLCNRHLQRRFVLGGILAGLYSISSISGAAVSGLHFLHKDWELSCDNSGTCRAAGYQSDEHAERPISILLQRAAGAESSVAARVKVNVQDLPPQHQSLKLHVLGRNYGAVMLNAQTGEGQLTADQARVLLSAVQGADPIIWHSEQVKWILSPAGASAVLLKMDDFQKRVGTPSALIRKGRQPDASVLKTQSLPLVQIKRYSPGIAKHWKMNAVQTKQLSALLQKTVDKDSCPLLHAQNYLPDDEITIYPLNRQTAVVEAPCWRGAYNAGYGYWVMDSALQKTQQFVTASGSSFSEGQIFSEQKGRGVADCIAQEEWAWNGRRFVQTYRAIQAQCKGFAGGA